MGLRIMGRPMALNLARAGTGLVVWNRSTGGSEALRAAGAKVAATPAEVFAEARVVILMLAGAAAIDSVLERGTRSPPERRRAHDRAHGDDRAGVLARARSRRPRRRGQR